MFLFIIDDDEVLYKEKYCEVSLILSLMKY